MTVLPLSEPEAVALIAAEGEYLRLKRRYDSALGLPCVFPQSQSWLRFTREEMEEAERWLRQLRQ